MTKKRKIKTSLKSESGIVLLAVKVEEGNL